MPRQPKLFELFVNHVAAKRPWAVRRRGWSDWKTAVVVDCRVRLWTRRRPCRKPGRPSLWLEGRGVFRWTADRRALVITES